VPAPVVDPAAPIVATGQTLSVDLAEIHVGDKFNAVSTITYSDGSTKTGGYYLRTNSANAAISKYWLPQLTAVSAGPVTIANDSNGFTSKVVITVLPAIGGEPVNKWLAPTPAPAPAPAPTPAPSTGDGAHPPRLLVKIARAGLLVICNAGTAETGSAVKSLTVDWGDGTPPESLNHVYQSVRHIYAKDVPDCIVTVTGTAADGSVTTQATPVNVVQIAEPPEPRVTAPGEANMTVTLNDGTAIDVTVTKGNRAFLREDMPALGSIVFHADGKSVCGEAMYEITTSDLCGRFKLNASGKKLWDAPEVIWAHSRTCPFWVEEPTINPNADFTKFGKWALQPNAGNATAYVQASRGPMDIPGWLIAMGSAGDREELGGPLRGTDADYVANPTAANASWVRRKADESAPWPYHCIDSKTQKMLLASDYPAATFARYPDDPKGNPILPYTTNTPLDCTGSSSHTYPLNALACELFGRTDFDCEEMALWANYTACLQTRPAYRMADNGAAWTGPIHTSGSARGAGRTVTILLYAAEFAYNSELFKRWANVQIDDIAARTAAQTGIQIDQAASMSQGYPRNEFAPWQHGMETEAVGHAVERGYKNAQAPFDLFATYIMDAILLGPHELLTQYGCAWLRADAKTPVDGWSEGLQVQATYNTTVAAVLQCAEGSPELQKALGFTVGNIHRAGDFVASDPTTDSNYIAQIMGAVARIRDHATDQVRAIAAYDKFHQYARVSNTGSPKWLLIASTAA
jgi:hypothetical protein